MAGLSLGRIRPRRAGWERNCSQRSSGWRAKYEGAASAWNRARLIHAAFFVFLTAAARTGLVPANLAPPKHVVSATRLLATRHTLRRFIHGVILFPRETKIQSEFGK